MPLAGQCLGGGGEGKGGKHVGLSRVGSKRNVEWLMEHVRDPKSHTPSSRMPGYGEDRISAKDLRSLGEYLASLK